MVYASAQMALDLVGDFLSECSSPIRTVAAKLYTSPLYPCAPHLEDPNQVDAETCSYRISLSHSSHGCTNHYSIFWIEIYGQLGCSLGNLLAYTISGSWHSADVHFCLPRLLCVPQ